MQFNPQKYTIQAPAIVSATLGEDGNTITIVMKVYDQIAGTPSDVTSRQSKSDLQQQVADASNIVTNIQAFLAVVG